VAWCARPYLSIDEIVLLLMSEIRRLNASRVRGLPLSTERSGRAQPLPQVSSTASSLPRTRCVQRGNTAHRGFSGWLDLKRGPLLSRRPFVSYGKSFRCDNSSG
jgi:hypothetical protein